MIFNLLTALILNSSSLRLLHHASGLHHQVCHSRWLCSLILLLLWNQHKKTELHSEQVYQCYAYLIHLLLLHFCVKVYPHYFDSALSIFSMFQTLNSYTHWPLYTRCRSANIYILLKLKNLKDFACKSLWGNTYALLVDSEALSTDAQYWVGKSVLKRAERCIISCGNWRLFCNYDIALICCNLCFYTGWKDK